MNLPDSIEFQLNDHCTGRTVSLQMTLDSAHISAYIEAYRAFLLAIGFHADNIKEYINEDN